MRRRRDGSQGRTWRGGFTRRRRDESQGLFLGIREAQGPRRSQGARRRSPTRGRRRRAREEVQARLVDRHHVGRRRRDGLEVERRVLRPRRDAFERRWHRLCNADRRRRLDDSHRRCSRPRQARRGPRDEWDLRFCDSSATRRPDESNRVDGADASDAANMRKAAAAPPATAPFFFSAAALDQLQTTGPCARRSTARCAPLRTAGRRGGRARYHLKK